MSQSTPGCYAVPMRLTLDPSRLLLMSLAGWLNQYQRDMIDYLEGENRVLRGQPGSKRLRLNDAQRRRLAVKAKKLGGRVLEELKTLVMPETLMAWHRKLIAGNMTAASGGGLTNPQALPAQSPLMGCSTLPASLAWG